MQKAHLAGSVRLIASHQMPAAVAVVAFTSFADPDGGFDFQPFPLSPVRFRIGQIRMLLMRIVLVRTVSIERIAENVRDEAAEIVALDESLQWSAGGRDQVPIDAMDHEQRLVCGRFQMLECQSLRQRNSGTEELRVEAWRRKGVFLMVGGRHEFTYWEAKGFGDLFQNADGEILLAVFHP